MNGRVNIAQHQSQFHATSGVPAHFSLRSWGTSVAKWAIVSALRPVSLTTLLAMFSRSAPGVDSGSGSQGPPLAVVTDVNPHPDIVEVHLTATESKLDLGVDGIRPHKTYAGSVPGPLLRAKRGDRVIRPLRESSRR
jgi:hypothetical protein